MDLLSSWSSQADPLSCSSKRWYLPTVLYLLFFNHMQNKCCKIRHCNTTMPVRSLTCSDLTKAPRKVHGSRRTWTKVHHMLYDQHSPEMVLLVSKHTLCHWLHHLPRSSSLTPNIVKEKTNIGNFSCGCEKKSCSGHPWNMFLHSFNQEKEIKIKQTYV